MSAEIISFTPRNNDDLFVESFGGRFSVISKPPASSEIEVADFATESEAREFVAHCRAVRCGPLAALDYYATKNTASIVQFEPRKSYPPGYGYLETATPAHHKPVHLERSDRGIFICYDDNWGDHHVVLRVPVAVGPYQTEEEAQARAHEIAVYMGDPLPPDLRIWEGMQ